MNNKSTTLKRLNFEDGLLVVFILVSVLNIFGNQNDKEYIVTGNQQYSNNANTIFEITLIITLFIYIYYFQRNYKAYQRAPIEEKETFMIKAIGSALLIAGIICLIYFQSKRLNFVGSPAP